MAQRHGPRNVMGERPARTPVEVAERLRHKMRELRGGADRRRAAVKAEDALAPRSAGAGAARGPWNEAGQLPTRSPRETAERLTEKLRRLQGAAIRRRVEAKTPPA